MGVIALLRQTYLDAAWYKNQTVHEGVNLSLQAWNNEQSLPQIFEANDKWNDIRADRIGDEFGVQYIIKAGGNEYQRIPEIAATRAAFYRLGLNFPQPMDVEDPNDARFGLPWPISKIIGSWRLPIPAALKRRAFPSVSRRPI